LAETANGLTRCPIVLSTQRVCVRQVGRVEKDEGVCLRGEADAARVARSLAVPTLALPS
jgi:hypothetical protein